VTRPIISLLHPTARVKPSEAFPRGWKDAHDAWLSRADNPLRIEYMVVVHESRWQEYTDEVAHDWQGNMGGWFRFISVQNLKRDCVVDQLNAAAEASEGSLLMGVMDDFYPPRHWDTLIIEALPKIIAPNVKAGWPEVEVPDFEGEYTIVCSSGASAERDRELMIAGADSRKRFERYGYLLDPDFESMYSDNWRAFQARRDEREGLCNVIERLDVQFDHRHPTLTNAPLDEVYARQNRPAAYFNGYNTFAEKAGLKRQRSLAVCLPGEEFRSEWVARWTMLFGHLTQVHKIMALPFFAHSSNVYCTRIELAQGVLDSPIPCDFSLWIDDDNTLTPAHFDMLLRDLDEHPELDGVVGWCWCDNHQAEAIEAQKWTMSVGRQGPNMECYRFTLEDFKKSDGPLLGTDQIESPDGFWSGFPCVLLRRRVLEMLGSGVFAPVFREDVKYKFTGEDTAFFWRAREAGLKFAVDVRVQVPHVKWRVIEPIFNLPKAEKSVELLELV
jgi:hypothetical protein